ncbi:conserved hypothetical protein [Methanococcus vannielii SB]|uniref:Clathrin/coatomer adaptor adaptin-like N-terminal domain-containing protein n=1 Tax=Methanococcus vannielii (strain ATCC 35089 / DSM 1224 / JCM 13029 / OCM 148 / SB) TaxID=406327 RepID=A6UQU6_METVS|nr:hypothetical protein [Methanococcus vannielii]ABR54868.1 conserved hypothetical protein [Methanococcus vannielii SB]
MIGSFRQVEFLESKKIAENFKSENFEVDFSDFRDILNFGKIGFENPEKIKHLLLKFEKALEGDFKLNFAAVTSLKVISKSSPKEIFPLIPKILKLLDNPDWRIRKNAVEFLGDFGLICYNPIKEHFEKLKSCLNDTNVEVIIATAYAISKIMLNSKCSEKINLSEILSKNITSKSVLMGILNSIGEINPDIIKNSQNDVFSCIDSNDEVLKSTAINVLGNFNELTLDKKTAKILINSLSSDNLEVKRSSIRAIWNFSKNYPELFKDSISKIIELVHSNDKQLKIYSILALNRLSFLEPQKFEGLNINSLLDDDLDVVYPAITLLYNLSLYSKRTVVRHYKKICVLVNSNDIRISKTALRIIGNLGKYDERYVNRYINNIKLKLSDANLSKDAALTMVKAGKIDVKVVEIILRSIDKVKNNMEFLRSVILEYPLSLLNDIESELKARKKSFNKEYIEELCFLIQERFEKSDIVYENFKIERPKIEEPPVIVALKSECTEVELEDGKKVYILPKEKCVETSLSGELLEVLDIDSKNEFEIYKLSHDLMIQSLIESTLNEQKR